MTETDPKLTELSFLAYVKRAWRSGVRVPVFGFHLGDGPDDSIEDEVVVCGWLRRFPDAFALLLAHERKHFARPDLPHEPWWSFDVFSANVLRRASIDRHAAVDESRSWRERHDALTTWERRQVEETRRRGEV